MFGFQETISEEQQSLYGCSYLKQFTGDSTWQPVDSGNQRGLHTASSLFQSPGLARAILGKQPELDVVTGH